MFAATCQICQPLEGATNCKSTKNSKYLTSAACFCESDIIRITANHEQVN